MNRTIARTDLALSDAEETSSRGTSLALLRLTLDCLCIVAALALALLVRFGFGWFEVTEASPPTPSYHAVASALWLLGLLGAFTMNRLYDEDTLFAGGGEFSRVARSTVETGAILTAFVFITQSFYVSRSWFGLVVVLSLAGVGGERLVVRRFLTSQRGLGKRRRPAVLVSRSEKWEDWPFEDVHEFEVKARIDPDRFEAFVRDAESANASMEGAAVVLRARDFSHDEFWRILLSAGERGWSVFVHSPVRSVGRDRLTVRELAGQTIVKVSPPVLAGPRAIQKRVLDIAISGLLLVLLSPVILVIGGVILLTTGTPVFYRQERVARRDRTFSMCKFRTMKKDSEEETGPVWTSADDPRRTRVGRFLRRTSLDELPQLWNVLRGDMSLVGPRPERPSFAEDFKEEMTWYRFRHRMRPGITGWAQSHGLRGNTSIDTRVQFDNWYIENWSIWLDLKILLKTVREVVRGTNAY